MMTSSLPRRRLLLVALGASALAAGALLLVARRPAPPPLPPAFVTARAPAEPPAPVARAPRSGCTFAVGEAVSYALTVKGTTLLDLARLLPEQAQPGGKPPAPRTIERTIAVKLHTKTLAAGDEGATLLATLRDMNVQGNEAFGELPQPFLLRVAPDCSLAGYARLDTTRKADGRAQQGLAYGLSWAWAAQENEKEERSMADSLGAYEAVVVRGSKDGVPFAQRRIKQYVKLWGSNRTASATLGATTLPPGAAPEGRRGGLVPISSFAHVEPGPGPWFESFASEEKLEGLGFGNSSTSTTARRIASEGGVFDQAPSDLDRYLWEDLLSFVEPSAAPPIDPERLDALRRLSSAEAWARYETFFGQPPKVEAAAQFLSAYLEARPDFAWEVARKLRAHEIEGMAGSTAFLALGKARTPEAREALLSMKDDPRGFGPDRSRSALALASRQDTGAAFVRSLRDDVLRSHPTESDRAYARHAALALGISGKTYRDSDPEALAEARQGLVQILHAAGPTASDLSPVFGGIGNLGDPALLSDLDPYSRSEDPAVRAEAVAGIRNMPPEATAPFVRGWLARETDPRVRQQIFHTSWMQAHDARATPDAAVVAVAIQELQQDPPPGVLLRQSIVHLLGEVAATDRSAVAALVRQAKIETDEGLIALIGGILSRVDWTGM